MKTSTRILAGAMLVASTFLSQGAFSTPIPSPPPTWSSIVNSDTCGGLPDTRTATLVGASQCKTGDGFNANATDIGNAFAGTWANQGGFSSGNGTNGLLTLTLTSGNWGGAPIAANWSLSPSYWSTYGSAVISVHVGEGNGSPDMFAFLLTPGTTSGTFSYQLLSGGGGGLSNVNLWSSGQPTQVPEPATLGLLGLGLAGVGFARRRKQG